MIKDKVLKRSIDYLNGHFPTDYDEINMYCNFLMKCQTEYEAPKKKYSKADKVILVSLVTHLQNRLVNEFNKHGFFTPFCLSLQEKLFMARELLATADKANNDFEMSMLMFTMAFDFAFLQKQEEAKKDDVDTSCIVFNDEQEATENEPEKQPEYDEEDLYDDYDNEDLPF